MSTNTEPSKEPRSILIIDDEHNILLGVKRLLERSGYKVTTCDDGLASIKIAEETLPDLIICDIMMPYLDGFTTREAIAANPLTKDIPFIFLTARTSQLDKVKGLQEGADDYITKPFNPLELVARVEAIFRRQNRDKQSAMQEISRRLELIEAEKLKNNPKEVQMSAKQILTALKVVLAEKFTDPDDIEKFTEKSISQFQRLNFLVNDLMFLNSFDKGDAIYLRQLVDIKNDFMLPIAQRQELYLEKKLQINIHVAEDVVIYAPRREFSQVIGHIADNAMKFAPPRSSVQIELLANGEGGCVLTVLDHGHGIPVELHEKVFERYYQIDQDNSNKFEGLGLGLTISRPITRSLGGDLVILPTDRDCKIQLTLPPAHLDMP